MSISVLDLINSAAKKLGVLFKGEALPADEANDGLVALNDLLDTWSNDDLITYAYTLESFAMTGANSYTIGTGGDFNTTRPIDIKTAVIRYGSIDYPMRIIPSDQYQSEVALKTIHAPIPKYLTYDNGYPLGIIKMYTVPDAGSTLYLQSNKPLSNFASLSTTVDLPPGWKRAIIYNLAIELGSEYGVQILDDVRNNARVSLGAIKRSTAVNNAMPLLSDSVREGNIYSGWYS